MELLPDVHQIDGVKANSYLILDDEITLIDTGLPGNTGKIINYLENNIGASKKDLGRIILTHHHFDHTGSLFKLQEKTNAEVMIHEDDEVYLSGQKKPQSPFFMRIVTSIMASLYGSQPVTPDVTLTDGVPIGSYKVIHTPGHTPGSICLYQPKTKVLFVGDVLRNGKKGVEGPVARFSSDQKQIRGSLMKLRDLDVQIMLSGHSPPLIENTSIKMKEFFGSL
jgi:glyoxylase-like metal-dependent hydrolase (beta-lactamase superfamily II)